jgi:hypothetical protein
MPDAHNVPTGSGLGERYRGLANANSIARQQFDDQQATGEETRPDAESSRGISRRAMARHS